MDILKIRHNWPEAAGFTLSRPMGTGDYVLLHFHNAVEVHFSGQQHHTAPGAFVIFSPDTNHTFISQEPLVHDWMHLEGPVVEKLAQVGLAPDTLYQPACSAQITELIAKLEAESFALRPYWDLYREALLTELFVLVAYHREGSEALPLPLETADRLRGLRSAMLMHPERKWSNEQMAKRLSISVSRLYPLYRRLFAISPNRDLILIRIERAKTMLEQGMNVTQTAEALGYSNVYHFSRQFKQTVGLSPAQFVRQRSIR